jgi:HPt (histidine-containing phosphotransfer) domain-containing protein
MVECSTVAVDRPATLDETRAVTPTEAPPLAPREPAIDLDHLARMTLGERKLEQEVLNLFDLQAGMLLARMTSEAPKVVAALAHTLSGSARGVGAWKVAAAAEAVERQASAPGPAALTGSMNRLSTAVTEAQAAIAELLQTH